MSIRFYNQFNRAAVAPIETPAKKPRAAKAKAPAKKKATRGQA